MTHYKVISLFSGCGGLDLGIIGNFSYLGNYYSKNPFKIIWANDINEKATETQKLNFKNINVVCGDIEQILDTDEPTGKPVGFLLSSVAQCRAS